MKRGLMRKEIKLGAIKAELSVTNKAIKSLHQNKFIIKDYYPKLKALLLKRAGLMAQV